MTLMISNMMMDNNNNTQKLTAMNIKVYCKPIYCKPTYCKPTNNFNTKAEKRMQNKQHNKRYAAGIARFRYNNQGRSLRW